MAAHGLRDDCVLVTFDIDGTLIESEGSDANLIHKDAFAIAFESLGLQGASIEDCKHHGMTDPLIIQLIVEHHRGKGGILNQQDMDQAMGAMCAYAEAKAKESEGAAGIGLKALPGVKEALESLGPPCFHCALTTGNLEPIAWMKMEALGLKSHFDAPLLGGFGSDYWGKDPTKGAEDRAQLLRVAHQRWVEAIAPAGDLQGSPPSTSSPRDHVHVGDSPYDIKAAVLAGAMPVGVTTGIFTEADLREAYEGCFEGSGSPERDLLVIRDFDRDFDVFWEALCTFFRRMKPNAMAMPERK